MVHDGGTADGIVGDAITRAMERVETVRPKYFLAWLSAIALNLARHWLRDRKIEERALGRIRRRSERSAFAEAISREALQVFDVELKRLTKMQRRAFIMRIIDRLSYREIARKMKLEQGAVRALLFRARNQLRGWLGYMRAL